MVIGHMLRVNNGPIAASATVRQPPKQTRSRAKRGVLIALGFSTFTHA